MKISCVCGATMDVEFSKNGLVVGGMNVRCPGCGIIFWIPSPGRGNEAVFFTRPRDKYKKYSQYSRKLLIS